MKIIEQDLESLKQPMKIIRRDAWGENERGVPGGIIKSGLFRASQSRNREMLIKERIGSIDGNIIYYQGLSLNMADDWPIIKALINHQKGFPIEDGFKFKRSEFLQSVFGHQSSFYYKKLIDSLDRMANGSLSFVSKDKALHLNGVSLVRKFQYRDELSNKALPEIKVWLEPEIILLLEHDIGFTDQIESKILSPQAIKVKDIMQNIDEDQKLHYVAIKDEILHSKATDRSFRRMITENISDQLITTGVIKDRIKIDTDGYLVYDLIERKNREEECVKQLILFEEK